MQWKLLFGSKSLMYVCMCVCTYVYFVCMHVLQSMCTKVYWSMSYLVPLAWGTVMEYE